MTGDYEYELRRGDAIIATGRLTLDHPPQVGDRLRIGDQEGIVRDLFPALRGQPARISLQLLRS
jgi:hypothetical protein